MLVAQASDIAEEYYFSFLLDRANRDLPRDGLDEGGMEIEQLAVERPEALARDPGRRHRPASTTAKAARDRRRRPASRPRSRDQVVDVARRSCGTSSSRRTPRWSRSTRWSRRADGTVVALDGKVTLDDNADFRHPDHAALEDTEAADPLEAAAKEKDLNYVKLDGEVGIIGNGAGLVMCTLDVVAYAGEEFGGVKPANFLDIGGGASAEVMANGLDIILGDPAGARASSSTSSAASPPATRSPTASSRALQHARATRRPSRSSSGSTATTSRRAGGSSPRPTHPLVDAGRHDGRRGRPGRRARRAPNYGTD